MTMKLTDLIDLWNTDEGKPYKGSLIDMDAYMAGPPETPGIGCMCAQGQILHFVGGWSAEMLNSVSQDSADNETAKLLNISRAHAVLLRQVNDRKQGAPAIVLTDPGKVLGDQWSVLLDFWWHIESMSAAARAAAGSTARDAAGDAARDAAGDAARDAAEDAAWAAAEAAAWAAAGAAAWASNEIQGATVLRDKGTPFFFLPLFGFASPEDIPARPANYGVAQ